MPAALHPKRLRHFAEISNYKKPRFWVLVVAIIAVIVVGIGLITNPQFISFYNGESIQIGRYITEDGLASVEIKEGKQFSLNRHISTNYDPTGNYIIVGDKLVFESGQLAESLIKKGTVFIYEEEVDWRKAGNAAVDFGAYPQDYSAEQGVKEGFFVVVHGEVKGDSQSLLNGFMQSIEDKDPAHLKILQYTVEGDPLFVSLIYHGGNAPVTANFDSTRDMFGTQTTTTSMQAKYIKSFEQDGFVQIYLTDKDDLTLEEALSGLSDCVNIVAFASMTLSNNDLFPINGEHKYLRLKMVKGKYYKDWNPGPYMGTIWEGNFTIELADQSGNVISRIDLNNIYKEPMIFNSSFQIQFDDYNNDGDIDFTIGQYASSNGRDYKLFTLKKGTVEELPIKGYSSLFMSYTTGFYSTNLTKIDNVTFKTEYYDNSKGKNIEKVFKWDGEKFINN